MTEPKPTFSTALALAKKTIGGDISDDEGSEEEGAEAGDEEFMQYTYDEER